MDNNYFLIVDYFFAISSIDEVSGTIDDFFSNVDEVSCLISKTLNLISGLEERIEIDISFCLSVF